MKAAAKQSQSALRFRQTGRKAKRFFSEQGAYTYSRTAVRPGHSISRHRGSKPQPMRTVITGAETHQTSAPPADTVQSEEPGRFGSGKWKVVSSLSLVVTRPGPDRPRKVSRGFQPRRASSSRPHSIDSCLDPLDVLDFVLGLLDPPAEGCAAPRQTCC